MKNLTLLLLMACLCAKAQNATDVYLFDMVSKGGQINISSGINVSKRKGYDNQPFFHPSKPLLYFASDQGGQTEIMVFDLKTGQLSRLTNTPESEYSPTVTPDGNQISCIVMRENKSQDLGLYESSGAFVRTLINDLTVGYHAWLNEDNLFLFVLGNPQTLQHYNLKTGTSKVIATSIGRSLHKVPGEQAISFIDRSGGVHGKINKVKEDGSVEFLTNSVSTQDDICWLPDGRLLSSNGLNILMFNPKSPRNWQPTNGPTLKNISRIAVSPNGKKLAVVVEE